LVHNKEIVFVFLFIVFELFNHIFSYSNLDIFWSLKFLDFSLYLSRILMILIVQNRIALNFLIIKIVYRIGSLFKLIIFLYLFALLKGLFIHAGTDVDMFFIYKNTIL